MTISDYLEACNLVEFYYYYESILPKYKVSTFKKHKWYNVVGKCSMVWTGAISGPMKKSFRWNKGTSYVSETVGFSFTIPYSVPGMPD